MPDELNEETESIFSQKQVEFINSLLDQHSSKINQSLNGLAARLTKSLKPDEQTAEDSQSERLSLKQLQTQLGELKDQLKQAEERRRSALIEAAIAPHSAKALDPKAFKNLLLAEVGNSLQISEKDEVFVEQGDSVVDLNTYLEKFSSEGAGRYLIAAEPNKGNSNFKPQAGEGVASTEAEILQGFLEAFNNPSIY